MSIGLQVAKRRKELNWTQRELAEKVGIIPKEISRIEIGRTKRVPDEVLLRKFSKVLQVPVSYFYGEEKGLTKEMPNIVVVLQLKVGNVVTLQKMIKAIRKT